MTQSHDSPDGASSKNMTGENQGKHQSCKWFVVQRQGGRQDPSPTTGIKVSSLIKLPGTGEDIEIMDSLLRFAMLRIPKDDQE